jgi:hypothetical protein
MGFLSGRVSLVRFQIRGASPGIFGPEQIERLTHFRAGRQKLASADGIETGWIAGDHILDTNFSLEKNIINDSLQFGFRVDSEKVPSDLLQAYYHIELQAIASRNGGRIQTRHKREAKAAARERIEAEAKDGRFTRRKVVPILWDARSNELWVGTTSGATIDQLHSLFEQTFETGFEPLTAGSLAYRLAETRQQSRGVDDAQPSPFVPSLTPREIAWVVDEDNRDFLGNEFLLWLWYRVETQGDSIQGRDGSEITLMLARTLSLECPRGQTGRETITSDSPTRLPESRRAIQSGKWPRKVGIIVSRHDEVYDGTLHAESLAITSCKMPPGKEETERSRLEERIDQLRHLVETLDLLYDAFGQIRHGEAWEAELARMQKWLHGK